MTELDQKLRSAAWTENPLFCDIGKHSGKFRVQLSPVYLTPEELEELRNKK